MSEEHKPLPGLFVVGTDTGVGKTFVTARIIHQLLAEGISVGAYKPVCSGSEGEESAPVWVDVETLAEALQHRFPPEIICTQMFKAPLAPPVAARLENRPINEKLLIDGLDWWRSRVEFLLVEGVGGLLCPLSENWTVCDYAQRLGFPLLIVARLGLGTINHTLLTVEVAQRRGLRIAGIILNESEPGSSGQAGETNPGEIARRCEVPLLAVIRHQTAPGLRPLPQMSTIDWRKLAGVG